MDKAGQTGRIFGYSRVSTIDQSTSAQDRAIRARFPQVEHIFRDWAISGAARVRPELDKCLEGLKSGDTLVVWRLDRLGRSLSNLVEIMEYLGAQGVTFISLTEGMDTTTPQGRLIFGISGVLAEFERELTRERVMEGIAAARAAGVRFGRPPALTRDQVKIAKNLRAEGRSYFSIARILKCSEATARRAIQDLGYPA